MHLIAATTHLSIVWRFFAPDGATEKFGVKNGTVRRQSLLNINNILHAYLQGKKTFLSVDMPVASEVQKSTFVYRVVGSLRTSNENNLQGKVNFYEAIQKYRYRSTCVQIFVARAQWEGGVFGVDKKKSMVTWLGFNPLFDPNGN